MPLIGVRELRNNTAEVLRQVREEKAEYIITHQGKPVALMLPIDEEIMVEKMLDAAKKSSPTNWEVYQNLAESLRNSWPTGANTQSMLDDIRGE